MPPADRPPPGKPTEVFVEFVPQGNAMRASAIDSASGVEVSIVGPVSAPRAALQAAVMRKLAYVLKQKRGED